MAVSKTMDASTRRVVFGFNVGLSLILAVALMVVVVYLGQRFPRQFDLTQTGVNSLSERTEKLLAGLDQDVKITGVYAVLSEYQKFAQKRQDMVRDLLNLYQTAGGGHVEARMVDPMKDPARIQELTARLREKQAYRDEAKPHEEVLDSFPELNAKIGQTADAEFQAFGQMAEADPRLRNEITAFAILTRNFDSLRNSSQQITGDLEELTKGDVPRYGQAVEAVRDYLQKVRAIFQDAESWETSDGVSIPNLGPDAQAHFSGANERFQPVLTEISALLAKMEQLKRVALEDVYDKLSRWGSSPAILVETANEARVLTMQDVWPMQSDPQAPPAPDGDTREFAGEQAVSSAILQLTQKEKTAVVFTRFGGESPIRPDFNQMAMMMGQMPRAPYQALNEQLLQANFVTEDWDVQSSSTPPEVEGAGRSVYVVLPPEPPPQQDPRRPSPQGGISPEQVKAITDAVDASGMAVFLAGFSPPSSPMMPVAGKYDFGEYLKTKWGVDVRSNFLAVRFTPSPQNPSLSVPDGQGAVVIPTPPAELSAKHPISKPLESLPAAFSEVCPVEPVKDAERPEGVPPAQVLVDVARSEDVWAVGDLMRLQGELREKMGTTRTSDDLPTPFPIALTVEKPAGEKKQRVVVFGSERFASDGLAQAMGLQLGANGLQAYLRFPANSDLFLNCLHWLTGDADRIAVGPRRADIPRMDKLQEGATAQFLRVFLVGIWPAVILIVGGAVWAFRRR